MRRLFVATVTVAVGCLALTLIASIGLARSLAACYLSWVPLPHYHMCGPTIWGHQLLPIGLLVIATVLLVASVTLTVRAAYGQFVGARRFEKSIGASLPSLPTKLVRATSRLNLERVSYVAAPVAIAATVGLIRPRVVITNALVELLTEEELEAVLLHEQVHVSERHPAIYGIARAAASSAFVLPAIRRLATQVVLESEIEADAAAIERAGRGPLVRALAKLLTLPPNDQAVALGSIRGMIDVRVEALAGEPLSNPEPRPLAASVLGVALVATPAVVLSFVYFRAIGVLS